MELNELIKEIVRQEAREEISKILAEKFANPSPIKGKYLTLKEAKQEFHLYGATLYRRIHDGHLQLIKQGGKSFLLRSEVEKLFVAI
jgi:hypothetical protein